MNGRLGLLACLLVSAWSAPVLAWGDLGHRIICEIAFQELNAAARERVKAMIQRDPEFNTFAESCSWPDHPRRPGYGALRQPASRRPGIRRGCLPAGGKCVISAIGEDLAVLASSSASEQEELEALKYLGH